jgi:KDO2-lipid IV(A) lauroyltransferase
MKAQLLRALMRAVGHLPLPLLRALGQAGGLVLWWLPTREHRVASRHLDHLFPETSLRARRRLARRSLQHLGCGLMESLAIWYGPRRRLLRWIDAPAAAARLHALADDTPGGAIVLCPHIGCWELAGMFCARHGGITSLYKPQKGAVDALMLVGRQRLGAKLVSSDGGGVRALLTALKRGERVGILPDQDPPPGAGDFAPLFGVPAHTPTLMHRLAERTGARVLYCYAERVGASGFRFHIRPAPAAGGGLAALNASVEACIMHLPDQYWWAYRRYRRRPAGSPDFYND